MWIFIFNHSNSLKIRHYPINKVAIHLTDLFKREFCMLRGEKCLKPIMIMRMFPNFPLLSSLLTNIFLNSKYLDVSI